MSIFIKAFLTGSIEPIRVLYRRWRAYVDTKNAPAMPFMPSFWYGLLLI